MISMYGTLNKGIIIIIVLVSVTSYSCCYFVLFCFHCLNCLRFTPQIAPNYTKRTHAPVCVCYDKRCMGVVLLCITTTLIMQTPTTQFPENFVPTKCHPFLEISKFGTQNSFFSLTIIAFILEIASNCAVFINHSAPQYRYLTYVYCMQVRHSPAGDY